MARRLAVGPAHGGGARSRAAALPSNVVPIRRDRPVVEPDPEPRDDSIDEIARLLVAPGGAGAPEFPDASVIEHRSMRDRTIADVLNDALDHLQIRWD